LWPSDDSIAIDVADSVGKSRTAMLSRTLSWRLTWVQQSSALSAMQGFRGFDDCVHTVDRRSGHGRSSAGSGSNLKPAFKDWLNQDKSDKVIYPDPGSFEPGRIETVFR
jgi:hypothetical protein